MYAFSLVLDVTFLKTFGFFHQPINYVYEEPIDWGALSLSFPFPLPNYIYIFSALLDYEMLNDYSIPANYTFDELQ